MWNVLLLQALPPQVVRESNFEQSKVRFGMGPKIVKSESLQPRGWFRVVQKMIIEKFRMARVIWSNSGSWE